MWKSNPPFGPRRVESPALKAGKVTGPLSPPLEEYHHRQKLNGGRKRPSENVPIKTHAAVSKNSVQARVVSSANACVRFSAAARS